MDESRTRALLDEISRDPEPPTGVDLDHVMAIGRRPRHRTAWAMAAAAAVVVAVLAIVALVRPDTRTPDPVVSVPAAPSPVTAPTSFDPLRFRVVPGWLPDGTNGRTHVVSTSAESYLALNKTGGEVGIYLEPRGAAPHRLPGGNGRPETGPDINGAPSTWEPGDDGNGLLRWEWAPGAPAAILVLKLADPRSVASRVASGLRLGTVHPVVMPFTVAQPTGLSVVSSRVEESAGSWDGELSFNGDGGDAHAVSVRLFASPPGGDSYFTPTTTVNGRPTDVETTGLGVTALQRSGGHDLDVNCQARGGRPLDGVRAECLRAVGSVRFVGTLDQPSTWGTAPVR